MLVIIHSGQTGVERGAHRAAVTLGLDIAGFMPLDKRDELGPVPRDVAEFLTPCFDRGPRPAVRANVALASGALIVVPDAETAEALDQAMELDRGDIKEWTAKAMTLLRAIQAADAAYKRELGEAFDRYRRVITTGSEDGEHGSYTP